MSQRTDLSLVSTLIAKEFEKRGLSCPALELDPSIADDGFRIVLSPAPVLYASGKLGMLHAAGRLLQSFNGSGYDSDAEGSFAAQKPMRGGDIGYHNTPHVYGSWSYAQTERYILDYALCGANIIRLSFNEHDALRSPTMRYRSKDWLKHISGFCDSLDLDVCVYYPNPDSLENTTLEQYLAERRKYLSEMPRLNSLMIPGGDPGNLDPPEVFSLIKPLADMLKEYHSDFGIWLTAQMPHDRPAWPEQFKQELARHPEGLIGVVHGPNQAMSLAELNDCSAGYPIWLYPDLTHDIRCQNFMDNIDYAMASTMSRESPNPRLKEFNALYDATAYCTVGSIPYSEGVNDDANKAFWLFKGWDASVTPEQGALRYARLFLYESKPCEVAKGILALEDNRFAPTATNPSIAPTYALFKALGGRSWRIKMYKMRAAFDRYVQLRTLRREADYKKALELVRKGKLAAAQAALFDRRTAEEDRLRREVVDLACKLYDQITYKLNTNNFGARCAERGAILDTMDLPVSACEWLEKHLLRIARLPVSKRRAAMNELLTREELPEGQICRTLYGDPKAFVMGLPMIYKLYLGDLDDKLPVHPLISRGTRTYRLDVTLDGIDPEQNYLLNTVFESASAPNPTVFANDAELAPDAGEVVPDILNFAPLATRQIFIPAGKLTQKTVISYRCDRTVKVFEVRLIPVK